MRLCSGQINGVTIDRKMQGGIKKYIPGIPDYQEYPGKKKGVTPAIQNDPHHRGESFCLFNPGYIDNRYLFW